MKLEEHISQFIKRNQGRKFESSFTRGDLDFWTRSQLIEEFVKIYDDSTFHSWNVRLYYDLHQKVNALGGHSGEDIDESLERFTTSELEDLYLEWRYRYEKTLRKLGH